MEKEDLGAWLSLGIGGGGCSARRKNHGERWSSVQFDKEEMGGRDHKQAENKKTDKNKSARRMRCAKKAIDDARSSSRGPSPSEEDADDGGEGATRKKLRLTKEQSTLLEDTFRSHNILSHVCLPFFFLSDSFTSILSYQSKSNNTSRPCMQFLYQEMLDRAYSFFLRPRSCI
jgi:hypothetical protein